MPSFKPAALSKPVEITALFSQVLDLPPCCLEISEYCPDHFVIGTYYLEKDSQEETTSADVQDIVEPSNDNVETRIQKRTGIILLCKLVVDTSSDGEPKLKVVTLQKLRQPSGIYDLHSRKNIILATTTTGSISVFELVAPLTQSTATSSSLFRPSEVEAEAETSLDVPHLRHRHTFQLFEKSTLVIALAWFPNSDNFCAVSLSGGHVAVIQIKPSSFFSSDADLQPVSIHDHTDNAWCVAWGHPASIVFEGRPSTLASLYSGGDDNKLRCTQTVLCNDKVIYQDPEATAEFQVSESGVTSLCLVAHRVTENAFVDVLLVGSYDNKVRLLEISSSKDAEDDAFAHTYTSQFTLDLGGTVHKLEAHGMSGDVSTDMLILASCAHAGVRILKLTCSGEAWAIQIIGKFEGHGEGQMNYASGLLFKNRIKDPELKKFVEDKPDIAIGVSTSWENRLMCAWKFDVNGAIQGLLDTNTSD